MSTMIAIAAGLACGILSGFGIGGGSLLMVWMTAVMDMEQRDAQTINLLYFLPTAAAALLFHIRQKQLCKPAILPAALCGTLAAAVGALLAAAIDPGLLRKLFGGFLLLVGITELCKKTPKK